MRHASRRRQHGAVIITVFLVMLFLLGFMGIALDFGKLFVVKSELQTAVDSCALAAAQELDLQPTALDRATSAGLTAGNLNSVNFQSNTWSGQGQLVAADITFKDTAYLTTTVAALAQYAQCRHVQPAVRTWLLQALGAFTGDTTTFPPTNNVMASAVATRAHGQSTCPIPVALKPKECPPGSGVPCAGPLYGFAPGEWITVLTSQSTIPGGYIGWANLDGSKDAAETKAEMNGKCGTSVDDQLGTPGTQTTIAEDWNYRFGIYKKLPDFSTDPSYMRPDYTGYSYTATNWPSQNNAYSGDDPGAAAGVENYATNSKAPNFAACGATVGSCEATIGIRLETFKSVAVSGDGPSSHGAWGSNRRIVTVPVTNNALKVVDFACMLMLRPLSIPMADVQLEFIGNASNPSSPCSFSGMPGGAAGPLVPALVR
jgi:Flp pilus assembly protein TadG